MKTTIWLGLAATAVLGAAQSAQADIAEFNFFLSGDQAVPGNDTDAAGAAQFIYDTDTDTFDLDLMVFGLELSDLSIAGPNGTPIHIHMAPAGANGPIVFDLGFFSNFFDDGLGIRFQLTGQSVEDMQGGIPPIDAAAFEAALFSSNLYVNIHTNDFPGGELRGQIIPTPGVLALLGVAGLVTGRRRRRA